jgi:hypothetical protein
MARTGYRFTIPHIFSPHTLFALAPRPATQYYYTMKTVLASRTIEIPDGGKAMLVCLCSSCSLIFLLRAFLISSSRFIALYKIHSRG